MIMANNINVEEFKQKFYSTDNKKLVNQYFLNKKKLSMLEAVQKTKEFFDNPNEFQEDFNNITDEFEPKKKRGRQGKITVTEKPHKVVMIDGELKAFDKDGNEISLN